MKRKNIVLIQTDEMHVDCLGLGRNPNVRTPNLDRLARQGVVFGRAVCNNPICMPSRVSMLSGQYCSTNGQFGFSGRCGSRTPWLQKQLHEHGYVTGAVGKFHCVSLGPEDWMFDRAAPTLSEDRELAVPPGDDYESYCLAHGLGWPTDQSHGGVPFRPLTWDERAPSSADPAASIHIKRACRSDVPVEHSLETWTTDRGMRFLRECGGGERPFFLWLTYDRPHFPTTLPEPWYSRIRPAELILPELPSAEDIATWPPELIEVTLRGGTLLGMGEKAFRFQLATYFTLVEWIDDEIGRFMAELGRLGLDEDTTVVFTSDHGDDAGYQGRYDKWMIHTCSEGITRVPLIIRPAPALGGAHAGAVRTEPVELVDLFPTLCALNGLPSPREVEGRDLTGALLRGEALDAHRPVFCEEYARRMILRDGWRLVFDAMARDGCMLVDLNADPGACVNRYRDPVAAPERLRLKQGLLTFLCDRRWGGFADADVRRVREGLDPDHALLPIVVPQRPGVRIFHRAAVVAANDGISGLIPLYGEPPLLFPLHGNGHRTRADVLPFDAALAESLVDDCLRAMILLNQPIGENAPIPLPDWPEQGAHVHPGLETIRQIRDAAG
jgi:arylsulfatase A-like enzyme